MKNKTIIFFVLFILFSTDAATQPVTWQKWYDYENLDNTGIDGIQTLDGGYLILGNTYLSLGNSTQMIKTNSSGNVEWIKLHDVSSLGSQITSCAITQTKDSGYVISGDNHNDSGILIKTNKLGDLLWKKTFSRPGFQARFFDHKLTYDGGIIACGDLFPPFEGFVVKTDAFGNLIWDSLYDSRTTKIIQSKDSNYYLTSNILMKINPFGKIIWLKNLPRSMNGIVQDNYGNIFTAGGQDSIYLYKYDSSGSVIFTKSFSIKFFHGMCISTDQKILIIGTLDSLGQTDIATVKVNLNGNLLYKRRILSIKGDWFKIPNSVKTTNDGGYIITGVTDYPQFPYHDNIIAVKTDSLCNAPLIVGITNNTISQPKYFELDQNYPNPFNSSTIIKYKLSFNSTVILKIYDIQGKMITNYVTELQSPGNYNIFFQAEDFRLSSGIYFYQLEIDSKFNQKLTITKKMIYLK